MRLGQRFTRKSGTGLRERLQERRDKRRNSTDPLNRLPSEERRRREFGAMEDQEDADEENKKLRRQSSRERRPKRRSVSNMPVEVGTRMLSRNRLRRNSSRRMSQNSMDWEFEFNYQLQHAKEKKQEREKEKTEADKMQRAETEQCANGLDKFWVRISSFLNPHLRVT